MPRFGVTWAPGAGRTTYRASLGMFHDWLSTGIYQQTLQFDGFRMQEVNVANPSFPDPGPLGPATPVQRYLLADDIVLPRSARASLGLSRTINPMVSVSAVYAYTRGIGLFVGENLNAPVAGVRPDPQFANVIEAVSDGRSQAHSLDSSVTLNLAGLGTNPTTGRFWQWRRGLRLSGSTRWVVSGTTPRAPSRCRPRTSRSNGDPRQGTSGIAAASASARPRFAACPRRWASTRRHDARSPSAQDSMTTATSSSTIGQPASVATRCGCRDSGGRRRASGTPSRSAAGRWRAVAASRSRRRREAHCRSTWRTAKPVARYRLNLSVNMQNLFNRPTYSGYSGVLTSPTFLQPSSASGVRRTTMNINLTF